MDGAADGDLCPGIAAAGTAPQIVTGPRAAYGQWSTRDRHSPTEPVPVATLDLLPGAQPVPSAGLSPRRAVQLAALLALTVFYAAQLAGALLPNVPVFIVASVAGLALDLYLHAQAAGPARAARQGPLRRHHAPAAPRHADRHRPGAHPRASRRTSSARSPCCCSAAYAAHFLCQAVAQLVRRTRTLPIVTRNIDTSALRLTDAPPRLLARQPSRRLLRFSIPGDRRA